jgi:hypothetical protein
MAAHVSNPSSIAPNKTSESDSPLWLKHPDEEQGKNVRIPGDGCGCGQICVALVDDSDGV